MRTLRGSSLSRLRGFLELDEGAINEGRNGTKTAHFSQVFDKSEVVSFVSIRWLKAHANDYGYDPTRIGVVGESAGGHLVAMLGATSGESKFDVGDNLTVTSDVNCVIDLFGVSDFAPLPNVSAILLGPDHKNDPDLVKSISPVTYVHKDEPPIPIAHGDSDKLAPYEQATRLADALDKVNARYHLHTVVGGGHNPYFGLNTNAATGKFDAGGGGVGIFADPDVQPMIRAYLRQYLLH
jgi:acetyl esterase/lipase